jgi:hypothetical protein
MQHKSQPSPVKSAQSVKCLKYLELSVITEFLSTLSTDSQKAKSYRVIRMNCNLKPGDLGTGFPGYCLFLLLINSSI